MSSLTSRNQPLPPGLGLRCEPLGLVVVHLDPLHLELRGSHIGASWVNAMLVTLNRVIYIDILFHFTMIYCSP